MRFASFSYDAMLTSFGKSRRAILFAPAAPFTEYFDSSSISIVNNENCNSKRRAQKVAYRVEKGCMFNSPFIFEKRTSVGFVPQFMRGDLTFHVPAKLFANRVDFPHRRIASIFTSFT